MDSTNQCVNAKYRENKHSEGLPHKDWFPVPGSNDRLGLSPEESVLRKLRDSRARLPPFKSLLCHFKDE